MLSTWELGNGSLRVRALAVALVGVAALAWTAVAKAQTGAPVASPVSTTFGGGISGFGGGISGFSGGISGFGGGISGFTGTGTMTGFTGGTGTSSSFSSFRNGFNGNWVGSFSGGANRGGSTTGTYGGSYGLGAAGTGTASAFSLYNVNPLAPGTPNLTQLPNFNSPIYGTGTGSLQGGGYGFGGSSGYGFGGPSTSPLGANPSQAGTGYGTGSSARRSAYAASPGFDYRPAGPNLTQSEVERVLARSTALSPNRNIRVVVEGPAVVLRGTVASDQDRRLAEALVRLTPGVNEVRNELKVPGTTPQPGSGP